MKTFLIAVLALAGQIAFAQVNYTLTPLTVSSGTNRVLKALTTNTTTSVIDVSRTSGFMLKGSFYSSAASTNPLGTGTLAFYASNSMDQLTWFPDPARNFSEAFSSNSATVFQTNFTGLVFPYETYGIGNTASNINATSELFSTGTKNGF